MIRFVKISFIIIAAVLSQVTLLSPYLIDTFQPNLLIIIVVYLGLRSAARFRGLAAFSLGLLQDCFSGLYLGLSGFSYLFVYLLIDITSDRLYTDSRYLMILVVFLASIVCGLLDLLLLLIFSAANGIYTTLLPSLLPQALVNALIASLIFTFPVSVAQEEKR